MLEEISELALPKRAIDTQKFTYLLLELLQEEDRLIPRAT